MLDRTIEELGHTIATQFGITDQVRVVRGIQQRVESRLGITDSVERTPAFPVAPVDILGLADKRPDIALGIYIRDRINLRDRTMSPSIDLLTLFETVSFVNEVLEVVGFVNEVLEQAGFVNEKFQKE